MDLVCCRYNKNHKVKKSRLLIHESKCPDRNNEKIKQCPYDPNELIEASKYEEHIKNCKHRPKISKEDEEEMIRAAKINKLLDEPQRIKIERELYYKGAVKEPVIEGLSKKKQYSKKAIKKFVEEIKEKNAEKFCEDIDNYDNCDVEGDMNNYDLQYKDSDEELPSTNKSEQTSNNFTTFELSDSSIKNKSYNFKYDPNEEDKDIKDFPSYMVINVPSKYSIDFKWD